MIRPFTIVTFMLACGSGLYLYQSKHEVQKLDRTISQVEHDIGVLRDQSRVLANDWTMLNDPERLRKFSEMYLSLKPTAPSQYASLADLDARLPPPRAEGPSGTAQDHASTVAEPDAATPRAAPDMADDSLPIPPVPSAPPPPTPAPAPAVRLPEHKIAATKPTTVEAAPPRPVAAVDQHVAEAHASRQPDHASDPRPAEAHPPAPPQPLHTAAAQPRPLSASPALSQAARPSQAAPSPAALSQAALSPPAIPNPGSLLGMARGAASLPAPRPMPVNATNWYNAN